jgi:hypothetical protein
VSYQDCYGYLAKKFAQWSNTPPEYDVSTYIRTHGKNGLVQEFKREPEFQAVCKYLAESVAGGNEEDVIYSVLNEILSPKHDIIPAELDIVVQAVLEACGKKKDSKGAAIAIGVILLAILSAVTIAASSKGRKRSR